MTQLAGWIVRVSAWLAPSDSRARWREEWLAEIDRGVERTEVRSALTVAIRALGAPIDALALRWTTRGQTRPAVWMGGVVADIRFSFRLLRRQPAFALAAWGTLALGIGATVAVYTVVYSVLLRPLPVTDEAGLAVAYVTDRGVREDSAVSYPKLEEWRAGGAFDDLAGIINRSMTMTDETGQTRRVNVAGVSLNFFQVVGAKAVLGRVIGPADAEREPTPAVISDVLWRAGFGADPGAVGRQVRLGDVTVAIVGVMPPGFHRWPREAHVWTGIDRVESAEVLGSRGYYLVTPIGRVRPGETLAATRERLDAVDRGTEERAAGRVAADGAGVRLATLREEVVPARLERVLLFLMVSVVLTWLVVCANLSSLLLARGSSRATELSIRLAVGADRRRLLRQVLVESASLAVPGGVLGALLALWGVPLAARFIPATVLSQDLVWVDMPVAVFAALLVGSSAFVFGLLPAVRASRSTLQLTSADRLSRRTGGTLRALLVAEIAVGVVVLVSAALLVKSVAQIRQVDLGFDPRQVLSVQVALPTSVYGDATSTNDARYVPVQHELLDRLSALPGVTAVTLGGRIFSPGADPRSSISFDDGRRLRNGSPTDRPFAPAMHFVGPDYFRVHGAELVRGRELMRRDDFSGPRVVLVNETMAASLWPGEDPMGRRVNLGSWSPARGYDEPWAEVIGVVRDIRHGGVELPARPVVYRSALQYPRSQFDLMLQTAVPPEQLSGQVRAAVRDIGPDILVYGQTRLADTVADAHAEVSYSSAVLSGLAFITSVLAAFGVYSVLAYAVTRRRRELGIRIALGADRRRIARDVARQVVWVLVPGLVAGTAAAAWSAHLLAGLLYEVTPRDPAVFAVALGLVTGISAIAAIAPARTAGRVDPISALRAE